MKFVLVLILMLLLLNRASAQLVINEICYDPSNTALEGDANGDGVYDQTQDEFIEFVNKGSGPLNISKYKIYDHVLSTGVKTLRHTVANNIVLPGGGAYVVFGGGSAVGTFGGAYVEVDLGTQGLSLGNTDESVIVEDSMGVFIDSINTDALSNNPNESYTRNPDFVGDFVQHGSATPGVLFSPGIRVEGGFFTPYTSVGSKVKSSDFKVFPNPGKGLFQFSGTFHESEKAIVVDASGRTAYKGTISQNTLDLGTLQPGLYRVRLENNSLQKNLVVLP